MIFEGLVKKKLCGDPVNILALLSWRDSSLPSYASHSDIFLICILYLRGSPNLIIPTVCLFNQLIIQRLFRLETQVNASSW